MCAGEGKLQVVFWEDSFICDLDLCALAPICIPGEHTCFIPRLHTSAQWTKEKADRYNSPGNTRGNLGTCKPKS